MAERHQSYPSVAIGFWRGNWRAFAFFRTSRGSSVGIRYALLIRKKKEEVSKTEGKGHGEKELR